MAGEVIPKGADFAPGEFVCRAEDAARLGTDRAEVAARAKAHARAADRAGREHARDLKRRFRPERLMDDVLSPAGADADRVVAFPSPGAAHDSPELGEAAKAATCPRNRRRTLNASKTCTGFMTAGSASIPEESDMHNIVNIKDAPAPDSTIAECRTVMEASGLSLAAVAREIGPGCSQATLSQWLSGQYAGNVAAVTARVRQWLDTRAELAKHALSVAGLDRHVRLGNTTALHGALAYAQAESDIVCVHGPSGAGKTTALRFYAETHRGATYVAMTVAVRTPAGMLARVADAVGAGTGHRSALAAETAIVEQLGDRNAILIVDEAHHLTPQLLDELRCIRDIARCGLALAGDDSLWAVLAGSRRCDQIVGRVGERIALGRASDEDVLALVAAGVGFRPEGAAAERVLKVARSPGGSMRCGG